MESKTNNKTHIPEKVRNIMNGEAMIILNSTSAFLSSIRTRMIFMEEMNNYELDDEKVISAINEISDMIEKHGTDETIIAMITTLEKIFDDTVKENIKKMKEELKEEEDAEIYR